MRNRLILAALIFVFALEPILARKIPVLRMRLRPMPPPEMSYYDDQSNYEYYEYNSDDYSSGGYYPYSSDLVSPPAYIPAYTRPIAPPPMRIRMTRRGAVYEIDSQFHLFFIPSPPNYLSSGITIYQTPSPYYPPYRRR